jgi:mannose-6-phosphate isomerase-like protein (cupin superfamily)
MKEKAMPPDGTANIARGPEDLRHKIKAQIVEAKPAFFKLEAQLPRQGRTDTPVGASDKMWVVLKTYAADGENGLHAHPNEDHTFVVLQGEATFYGPNDETRTIGKNEGVLLPTARFIGSRRRATSRWSWCASARPHSTVSTATAGSTPMAAKCGVMRSRTSRSS